MADSGAAATYLKTDLAYNPHTVANVLFLAALGLRWGAVSAASSVTGWNPQSVRL